MVCFYPLHGYRAKDPEPSGKRRIVFDKAKGFVDRPVTVPCGQCVGCRMEYARQWAIRICNEAQDHDKNCFITLTYDDSALPYNGGLHLEHFQKFMKRLRKRFGAGIRFYHCGEYGDQGDRPHYHAVLFNIDFEDKVLWKIKNDNPIYLSEMLSEIWGQGFTTTGDVTFESAAYVAKYCLKKRTGEHANIFYQKMHPNTGEVFDVKPEYCTMSRGYAIGSKWLERYKSDAYPSDYLIMNGRKIRPPKAYDRWLETTDPKLFREIKRRRKIAGGRHPENNTKDRLRVRETVLLSKMNRYQRSL